MSRQVENPTLRTKAVRVVGGHVTLKPGAAEAVSMDWPEGERQRYEAAGLKIKDGAPERPVSATYTVRDKGRGWFVIMQGDQEVTKSLREDTVADFADLTADEQAAFVAEHKPD